MGDKMRSNSPDQDPDLTVPLQVLLPVTLAAATYTFARAYVVLESSCNPTRNAGECLPLDKLDEVCASLLDIQKH